MDEGLGKALVKARKKAGYSQIDAAAKVGVSNGFLSMVERGERDPSTDTLKALAELYGRSVDEMLGVEGSQPSLMFEDGGQDLTEDEIEHLQDELQRFRELKKKFQKD
ncbi:helix-turn-helix protein [Salsuginibacillus halophilus]|uniref:Helix-turn-helix protein n=1 Tax=Salsuginibacillus halophilus TaxID=517424 RepID=A0A2P8H6C8_9BACI|nr:helix-turn-helix transcriptional regulator [Salsuginibacillus halophilus]PSL41750.1 helix-turn-helix protein [Salsuginibacillus halophilus]